MNDKDTGALFKIAEVLGIKASDLINVDNN